MSWLIFAFSGPVLWALSTHLDKYLIERYFKEGSVASLMVFTAVIGLLVMPFVWFFNPEVMAVDFRSAFLVALSGVLYMTAIYFYLQALQSEEASTVAPFFQAAAVFGLGFGFFFLGEKISPSQILGTLMIIGGSSLISFRFSRERRAFNKRLLVLMLSCAFAIALGSFIFKYFAIRDDFWPALFWSYCGDAVFGVFLLSFAANRRQLAKMLRTNTGAVVSINAANELINLGGGIANSYAYLLAPLGVVQAISSTTSFFVLGFGILLSLFFPKLSAEKIGFGNVLQKTIAIVLVTAGVILVNK